MLLYDMNGVCCGHTEDQVAQEGYFLRHDGAPTEMSALEFLEKIGPERFGAIWQAAASNPTIAYLMMRGFAAQSILIGESFPALMMMEQAELLPAGTAFEIWDYSPPEEI